MSEERSQEEYWETQYMTDLHDQPEPTEDELCDIAAYQQAQDEIAQKWAERQQRY